MVTEGKLDTEHFKTRHVGPRSSDVGDMLELLGYDSLDALMDAVVPDDIRLQGELQLPRSKTEAETVDLLRALASRNQITRSFIGMGYSNCHTPAVILRNILENPGWYTAYTPYQPEISQGRLEALLNYQTVITDLTGLEIANASLLDEGTAAAEAMTMCFAVTKKKTDEPIFLVDENCHPQSIAVVRTRAEARDIVIKVSDPDDFELTDDVIGVLLQYPATDGRIRDFGSICEKVHEIDGLVTVAADILSLVLLESPATWGADICIGNTQRFGVPMGYGGPHAAYFATREAFKRSVPGRIIGISRDRDGNDALRMALQTREQHIRRDKATSNICTAQVLLAVMAGMYAVYHGPEGLRRIARRVHELTGKLADGLTRLGLDVKHDEFFDTLLVEMDSNRVTRTYNEARERGVELRGLNETSLTVSLDETTTEQDLADLLAVFNLREPVPFTVEDLEPTNGLPEGQMRRSEILTHPVFHRYRSETEMLRYLKKLEDRDLSLTSAMIPLGSCTMKLNGTTEMEAITWPGFADLHPFTDPSYARGYHELFERLEQQLAEITGFHSISMQPNAGSQGEFSGLMVIRSYHESRGEGHRNVCLIPKSAHGTNPASAVMAGMKVVTIETDERGDIDVGDLRETAEAHKDSLAAFMVTYPSTHGVFEAAIKEACEIIHENGGQVYMDGANLNAMVGLCKPADIGADVCHLNLHKTFCIPHGGGGPGMGPIGVAEHLAAFLPTHPVVPVGGEQPCGTIAAAPWGSPAILPISWAYIEMMGHEGLLEATQIAILNANYVAKRLEGHFDLLYSGENGLIGHECIIDPRPLKQSTGVGVEDVAKRLIDYGFHPPTISFPVPGTMMVEPTESESREELDRFCDALIAIRKEMREIERGQADAEDNLLKNAPHTLAELTADEWEHPYSRERAAFPTEATREHKIWPPVSRIDGAWGDRNLVCSCLPTEAYATAES